MRETTASTWRLALGFLVITAASAAAGAASLPSGFTDTAISRPGGQPWDRAAGVAFADDGRLFVWERPGRVWLVTGALAAPSAPLIDLGDEVSTIGSLGLTGFALDPQFARNGYLYLFYAVEPQHLANCDAPTHGPAVCRVTYRAGQHASSGATLGRLVRYQLVAPEGAQDYRTATQVNAASRRVLVGESPAGGGPLAGCLVTDSAHGPGGLAFGNDGTLLAACGDGASARAGDSGSDPDTEYQQALAVGLMTAAENVGAFRAQLVDSLSGKILRLNAATGDGVPSNPFYDPAAPRAARSRVWVLGLHDPQHFTVRPGTGSKRAAEGRPGTLYIGEVGSTTWESLAVASVGSMNFGWPLYEGVGDETTDYASLPAFNLQAPNPVFPGACPQPYFRFQDLIGVDSLRSAAQPNPCRRSTELSPADEVFVRERPAIDWLHGGANARWAGFSASGEPLALTLGTRAPNGTLVSGPLFGGTASIGGVWYEGSNFPAPYRDVYFHADSGGEWIKAFTFDDNDSPVAVRDFLANGGPIRALGVNPVTGALTYITGLSRSEVRSLTYSPADVAASRRPATTPMLAPTLVAQRRTADVTASGPVVPLSTRATRKAIAAPTTVRSAALPSTTTSTWSNGDIGTVAATGSYSLSGGTFTVMGSGADIWSVADHFQFVYQALSGDGSITARVVSQTNTSAWAKAGVMIRETLATGSRYAAVELTPSNGVVWQDRAATGGEAGTTQGPIVTAPYWVRVVRAGNTFTGYLSSDGVTWTSIGHYTITMASQVYVGLAVCSHFNGILSTTVFDNVTVTAAAPPPPDTQPPTVPTGLAATSVTATTLTLSWSASTDLPNPGGSGVGGYYVYRNGNTTTPIATVTSGTTFTDSGLTPATAYTYQVAAFDRATPANISAPSSALSVTTQSVTPLTWSNGDIGTVAATGSYSLSGGTFTVMGSGADIWSVADHFQFVYQALSGDGSITARVVSQTNTSAWAKAGVMIRETLATGSRYAAVELTPSNGVVWQDRAATGGEAGTTQGPIVTAPYWVRVVRAGNTFTGYLSSDGVTWTSIGHYTITMASQVYVGLAVCSHFNGILSTTVFDNVTVTAAAPPPPDTQPPTVPTGLAATSVTATTLTLSWSASTDLPNPGGSGVGGYYVYRNGNTTTPIATVTSGTTFTDSGLTPATAYTYQVAAFDRATPANISAPSSTLTITTRSMLPATQITNLTVNNGGVFTYAICGTGTTCGTTGFVAGVPQYVDSQSDEIAPPVAGIVNGQPFIQTAQGDSSTDVGSTNFISFTLGQSATVYVAHDVQVAPLPGWLKSNFMDTGASVTNTNGSTFEIYSNIYPSGAQVQLGANTAVGATPYSMYSVIIAPTAVNTIGPNAPTALSLIPNCHTATVVGLSWSAATINSGGPAIAGYRIARNATPIATVSYAQTSYQDTTVDQSTAYSYTVTAFDQAGNVSPSPSLNVTTNPALATGDAPYCQSTMITGMSFNFLGAYSETNGNGNSSPTSLRNTPPYTDGSDLWPVTQAADGNTYAFFGDGWGVCGMGDTTASQSQDNTSFGFAKLAGPPTGAGCPGGWSNLYGGYNSRLPYGGYKTCCTSNNGLILGKASAVVAIGNDFYAVGGAWRNGDANSWINIQQGSRPPLDSPQNHQEIISSTGPGNGGQQWTDSATDLCNATGTATNPVWAGALGICPLGFVQFSAGYTGLPASLAGYVYLYAIPAPAFFAGTGPAGTYLLRVPTTPSVQLLTPSAYQYFAGLDLNGNPIWSSNSNQKQLVFDDQIDQNYHYASADGTSCAGQRIFMGMVMGEAIYDAQLRRFIASAEGAHVGQVAFYEAANPWGPWSVISYSNLSMGNIFASGWGASNGGLGGGFCSGGSYIKAISLGIHMANGFTDPTGTVLQIVFSSNGEAPASSGALGGYNANSNGYGNSMDSLNIAQATLTIGPGMMPP
jgi:chitodextrinase/regulation of enolase protein 1 (concanavalin A-like superfamily)